MNLTPINNIITHINQSKKSLLRSWELSIFAEDGCHIKLVETAADPNKAHEQHPKFLCTGNFSACTYLTTIWISTPSASDLSHEFGYHSSWSFSLLALVSQADCSRKSCEIYRLIGPKILTVWVPLHLSILVSFWAKESFKSANVWGKTSLP